MNKRFAALCLTVVGALALVLAGCGGAPNGDGGGTSDTPPPRTTCVGDWTLASIEADGVTVVGDLSAMTGEETGMALTLQEGGSGSATLGERTVNLSWEEGEGGAITLRRAAGEAETDTADAPATNDAASKDGASASDSAAAKKNASDADAKAASKRTSKQASTTAAKRDVSGADAKAAETDANGKSGASVTFTTSETAAPGTKDAAPNSAQDSQANKTTKKRAKTPIGTLFASDDFAAEGNLDNGVLIISVKDDSFTGRLIFATDGAYSGPMPVDPTTLGTISAKDAMVGDWTLSGVFMSGATLHGNAEDLAAALGIAEDTSLSIKDDGTVVALGQQTTWELGDQGATIAVGGVRLPVRSSEDGIALDASELLSSQVIMLFTKKA